MGFRTAQLYGQATGDTPPEVHHGLISHREWVYQPEDEGIEPCYTRACRGRRPPEAHACVPHPEEEKRSRGWMVCFIFLALVLVFACVVGGVLPLDLLVCSVGVC